MSRQLKPAPILNSPASSGSGDTLDPIETITPGTYPWATVTVDQYGRVTGVATGDPEDIVLQYPGWPIYERFEITEDTSTIMLAQAITQNPGRHLVVVNGLYRAKGADADYTMTATTITFTWTLEPGTRVLVYAFPSTFE